MGVAMRAFSAKVAERSAAGWVFSASWAGAEGVVANGFEAGLVPVENGFAAAEPGAEKGLAFWLVLEGCTPKRDSPMLVCLGLGSSAGGGACSDDCFFWAASWAASEMRVDLIPRMDPAFLRQAFCLHAKT